MTDPAPHALVLAFVLTVRHDGHGGVADDLAGTGDLASWIGEHADGLGEAAAGTAVDEHVLAAVRDLRTAVRSLFARAVRPGAPSRADEGRLLPADAATARLNAAAAAVPVVPVLRWPDDGEPVAALLPAHARSAGAPAAGPTAPRGPGGADGPLTAVLARAAIDFLTGPDRTRLRACHAPRCVRYFVKDHPRQEWCKPACGNRARVARHHERHRAAD
ncbi:CGNR zinc finger domain-containing protein [Streptomyces genisteinicus]|uniref:CGNR zinc finger domain-containing protein n=1 Tax=Streptomyces genisteinicus TaxID=2768068 RepID=A0A7H0HMU1_9ACTN|nr:CGNR zinc finger domain-containing protein [Streptomyces genisteinicus]QNP61857.1 CGNR zinc finger domain-containing protein [Streptomyces genisteinicus]